MHLATLHVTPILAAGKSKVPFYVAGGVLVAWALIVSLGLGLRRPDFPGSQAGQRLVMAITVVLVAIAASTAVITSSADKAAGGASTQSAAGGESAPAPATPAPASSPATTAPASSPKATTGTPPPSSSPAAGASSSLKLATSPAGQLSYDTKALSAKAGTVTITLANLSQLEHNVTIASGSTVLGTTPTFAGGSRSLTLKLKAGTYTFYCSVPGHRQAGMEGTLTVS